jgi:hypothetical protein
VLHGVRRAADSSVKAAGLHAANFHSGAKASSAFGHLLLNDDRLSDPEKISFFLSTQRRSPSFIHESLDPPPKTAVRFCPAVFNDTLLKKER